MTVRSQEIPTGQGNRVRAEVTGLFEQECTCVDDLMQFFSMCFENRSTSSTNLNATSSRSHALFTINVHRVVVSVGDGVDEHLKVRICSVFSRQSLFCCGVITLGNGYFFL